MPPAKPRAGVRAVGAGVVLLSAATSLFVPGCLDPLVEDPGVATDGQFAPGPGAQPGVPVGSGGAAPTSVPGSQAPPASTGSAGDGNPEDDTTDIPVSPSDGPSDPATTSALDPSPAGDRGLAESADGGTDAARISPPDADAGTLDAGAPD